MRTDDAIGRAASRLAASRCLTSFLDAEILLAHATRRTRVHLLANPEQPLTKRQSRRFDALLAMRLRGVPVAYLIGGKEFFGLPLRVTRRVLIPCPETETLATIALQTLPAWEPIAIADIGTGSGALAIALAVHRPVWRVYATDRSKSALAVAMGNARRHGVAISFHRGDLLKPMAGIRLDAIVANLPYLPTARKLRASDSLRFAPAGALWSGRDGLHHYRRLLCQLGARHERPRLVVCELEQAQVPRFGRLLNVALPDWQLTVTPAGNGIAAVTLTARRPA